MNELLSNQIITSREIASLTGKKHAHLMRDIREMEPAWVKVYGRNFPLVQYTDGKGEKRPQYILNKKECLYIATKFNDEARARLINRWEELENQRLDFSNPDNVLMLAQNWKAEYDKRIQAEKEIKLLTPKAELMDKVLDADEKIDVGQAAKILELGFGRNTLFKHLREKGVFFRNRNEPRQEFINRGYFVLKEKFIERNSHDGFVVTKVLVTQRGLEFINKIFDSDKPQHRLALNN